ncbi:MAG: NAD-dependent epimerase/dehydratase family protein [Deltaproteobacteria bacterium]|nr:NAD-dependent epimerase/dehydratase family protein [Deltaproteobacteria bacterium]
MESRDYDSIRKDLKRHPIGFGLERKFDLEDNSVVVSVLNELGISMDKDRVRVTIWGSGSVYREFLHVDDLADACIYLMEKIDAWDMCPLHPMHKEKSLKHFAGDLPDYFVNVGKGEDLLVKDLARLTKEIVGFKGDIYQDRSKPDGTPRKLLDITRMKKLGWEPKILLEEGIKKTYEWYLNN